VGIALLAAVGLFFLLDLLFPFPNQRLQRPAAIVVFDRNGDPMRIILPADQKVRIPVGLNEVPPELLGAVIASEDRWFYRHPGVNPVAIVRAIYGNVRARRRISGASTIPMQIARLAEPKSRTVMGKAREAFRALQLTLHYTKRRQLELYLNMAPYGGNIEGIGAASMVYFGKRPAQLSIGEIAFLTTLPRSPNKYDPLHDHAAATLVHAIACCASCAIAVRSRRRRSPRRCSNPCPARGVSRRSSHLTSATMRCSRAAAVRASRHHSIRACRRSRNSRWPRIWRSCAPGASSRRPSS